KRRANGVTDEGLGGGHGEVSSGRSGWERQVKSDSRCVVATRCALRFTVYALRAASALGSAIIPQIFPDLLPLSSNARRVVDGERVPIWVHRQPRRRVVAAQHSHFAIILIAITDVFT